MDMEQLEKKMKDLKQWLEYYKKRIRETSFEVEYTEKLMKELKENE